MKKMAVILLSLLAMLAPVPVRAAPPAQVKLIVESFRVDKAAVPAGETCALTFTVRNTHPKWAAQNITVSVKPADGALLPRERATLYADKLDAGAALDCAFTVAVSGAATPGAHAVAVEIDYEDGRGFPCTAQCELPVETLAAAPAPLRLRADEPVAPPAGAKDPVIVTFGVHNLGRGTVHNLSATAEGGRLTVVKDAYAGNLESGESRTVELTLAFDGAVAEDVKSSDAWRDVKPGDPDPALDYPAEIVLTYEDAEGNEQRTRLPFTAKAVVPRPDEPSYAVPEAQTAATPAPDATGWAVAGVAVVAAAAAVLLALRRKKAAK